MPDTKLARGSTRSGDQARSTARPRLRYDPTLPKPNALGRVSGTTCTEQGGCFSLFRRLSGTDLLYDPTRDRHRRDSCYWTPLLYPTRRKTPLSACALAMRCQC
eukprot:3941089-Rhodomonas_salina.6